MNIPIRLIETFDRLRKTDPVQVDALASSMKEVGLINPITVYAGQVTESHVFVDGWHLVAGLHRLKAARQLGWTEIEAHVVEMSDLHRQLIEVDENLCGTKLTPAERARFTQRRKDIYIALYPKTKAGVAGGKARQGSADDKLSFAADTAKRTGQDVRTVQRDAARGKNISDEVLEQIKGTDLDKGCVLDRLAKGETVEQVRAAPKKDAPKKAAPTPAPEPEDADEDEMPEQTPEEKDLALALRREVEAYSLGGRRKSAHPNRCYFHSLYTDIHDNADTLLEIMPKSVSGAMADDAVHKIREAIANLHTAIKKINASRLDADGEAELNAEIDKLVAENDKRSAAIDARWAKRDADERAAYEACSAKIAEAA